MGDNAFTGRPMFRLRLATLGPARPDQVAQGFECFDSRSPSKVSRGLWRERRSGVRAPLRATFRGQFAEDQARAGQVAGA